MTEQIKDARHYSLTNIDVFWQAGNPIVLPIAGSPECTLMLHPQNETVTLSTPFVPPEPNVTKWRNIKFQPLAGNGGTLAELTVQVQGNLHGAYSLLAAIADRLQLAGDPLAAAVASAIAKHRDVFAGKAALTPEKEVGLFGELLVVEYLVDRIGAAAGIAAWQGPLNEEHDFVFSDVHLEIKTTSGEQRRHMMHGFEQLVPLRDVPLSLVSVQLTRSNHEGGRTLSQLVSQVRAKAGGHRPELDIALDASGWKDEDAELYGTFWTKRSEMRAYDVDDQFPALTTARLAETVPNLDVINDLSYRVDVTHFANHSLPGALADLVDTPEDPK